MFEPDNDLTFSIHAGELRGHPASRHSRRLCPVAMSIVVVACTVCASAAFAQATLTVETLGLPVPEVAPECVVSTVGEGSLTGSGALGEPVVLEGLEEGVVTLVVRADGYERREVDALVSGDSTTFVELYADARHPFEGVLTTGTNVRAAGVSVVVQGVGAGRSELRFETISDALGAYAFPAIPVGRYDVAFRDSVAELVRRDVLVTGPTRLDAVLLGQAEEPETSTSRGCAVASRSNDGTFAWLLLAPFGLLAWVRRRW